MRSDLLRRTHKSNARKSSTVVPVGCVWGLDEDMGKENVEDEDPGAELAIKDKRPCPLEKESESCFEETLPHTHPRYGVCGHLIRRRRNACTCPQQIALSHIRSCTDPAHNSRVAMAAM